MNKYQTLMLMVLFLVFTTIVASSINGLGVTTDITSGVGTFELTLEGVLEVIQFFFAMLFFQVSGVPNIINLLVFWPLTLGILLMIIGIIRGTD